MGVDCRVYLPSNVRLTDVCTVVGRLVGFPVTKENFHNNSGWYANVNGVKAVSAESSPELFIIQWLDSEGYKRHMYWNFEGENNTRILYPSSTAFWVALSARLVEFFGGQLNICDTGDDIDLDVPAKSDAENRPKEDPDWTNFQQRIMDLKSISSAELNAYASKAAYGSEDHYAYLFDKDGYMVIPVKKEK
jgi:hypothetical protein